MSRSTIWQNKLVRKSVIFLFWAAIWEVAALCVHTDLILAGPVESFLALLGLVRSTEFWITVFDSCPRIYSGFFFAFLTGAVLGTLSYRFSLIRQFLSPLIGVMKAVPVASFVVFALVLVRSSGLTFFIVAVVVIPVVYHGMLEGLQQTPKELLEMSAVFRVPLFSKIRDLYRKSVSPFLLQAAKLSCGLSWKAGVAAEVIGTPSNSIGERIYMTKIYLETADLFAWTFVCIVLSFCFEKWVIWLLKKLL